MDKTLGIWGTYTCDPMKPYLEYCLKNLSLEFLIEVGAYNQIFQHFLSSSNNKNKGIEVFLIRFQDWGNSNGNSIDLDLIEQTVEQFVHLLENQSKKIIKIIVVSPGAPLFQEKHAHFFETLEKKIREIIEKKEINTLLVSSKEILKKGDAYYDEYGDKEASMPYTPEMYAKIATAITRRVFSIVNKPPKVVVLDCDNTLWKGVCGEDGSENVQVSFGYQYLQNFFKRLISKGVLLCMSSKNYEQDVMKVFKRNSGMILNLDDFVTYRINWEPKSKNILSMSKELNLHLKDFIFVDDNVAECAEVSHRLPDIMILNLPKEEEDIQSFLDNIWQFDIPFIQTEEDKKRTQMYKTEALRNQMKSKVGSFEEFIKNLNLNITLGRLDNEKINRISQLTYRVNQFNFTGKQYSDIAIESQYIDDYGWRYVHVSDKFGDYGIVGAILFSTIDDAIEVQALYLSCRVLGRNIEYKIISEIASVGKKNGIKKMKISYIETGRNQVALNFLKTLGGRIEDRRASKKTICLEIEEALLFDKKNLNLMKECKV